MASGRTVPRLAPSEQLSYFCCKSKTSKLRVCVTCGRVYHEQCMLQDGTDRWAMKLDETRLICYRCEVGFVMSKGLIDQCGQGINRVEVLLRAVVKEMLEKNRILSQSNNMLSQNLADEKRKTAQLKTAFLQSSGVSFKPPPEAPRIPTAISNRISEIMRHTPTIEINPNPPILPEYKVNIATMDEPKRPNNIPPTEGRVTETNQIKHNPPIPPQHKQNFPTFPEPKKPTTEDRTIESNPSTSPYHKANLATGAEPKEHANIPTTKGKMIDIKPKYGGGNGNSHHHISQRPAPMRGTNRNHTNLKLAPKPSWIFVSGFDPNTREDDIMHFLESHNLDDGCECYKMYTKKDQIKSSFRLGVPVEKMPQLMASRLWPKGVLINYFQNLPVAQQQYAYPILPNPKGPSGYYGFPNK